MRNYLYLSIILVLIFLLTGCNYATLEEAIKKDIPYEVIEVLYTEKMDEDDLAIVLYTTKAEGEEVSHIKGPVLGVAIFEGNNEDGWKNGGPN